MSDGARRWRVGYASGAFDMLHLGHARYLMAAAALCDQLIVGVPDDAIVARVKGRAPIITATDRLELVATLKPVARALLVSVAMDDTEAFADFLPPLGVEVALIGAEWAETPRWRRLGPALAARGLDVTFIPRTHGVSSTQIRQRLLEPTR